MILILPKSHRTIHVNKPFRLNFNFTIKRVDERKKSFVGPLFVQKRRIFDIIKLWGLNEHSNGLLRRDGLPKQTDFNELDEEFRQAVSHRRNRIPRKFLNYRTPLEVFLEHVSQAMYGSNIVSV